MRGFKIIVGYWLPVIAWMGLIFFLSSQTKVSLTHKFIFDFIIFKTLHAVEYAILYFLLFRAFYSINKKKLSLKYAFIFPIIIGFFYSITDELHQLYVPTRSGQLKDTGFDLLGIILMYTFIKIRLNSLKKFL